MDEVKEIGKHVKRVAAAMERQATALEKLLEEATEDPIKFDAQPPVCPHCGNFDPVVDAPDSEGSSGPLSEIIIVGDCTVCGNRFYVVPESYNSFKDVDEVIQLLKERREGGIQNG